jgi:ABC-type antimicrobial peptide transport system permease subunit
MALGAQRKDALWLVLRQGLVLAFMGTAIGLPAALAIGIVLRSLLFGISPMDPVALAGSSLLVVGLALFATYLPARRAIRINPMEALRHE